MKAVIDNLGIGEDSLDDAPIASPQVYTDFLYLGSHVCWISLECGNQLLLLVAIEHVDQAGMLQVDQRREEVLMPLMLTKLVQAQTLGQP